MVQGEFLGTRRDGSPIWIEYSTRAFFNPDGSVAGYIAVHRDTTERRRFEQQLSEQAFLLANVSDAVIGFDLDFQITYWSPSAERVYGFTPDEAIGRRTLELLESVNTTMTTRRRLSGCWPMGTSSWGWPSHSRVANGSISNRTSP